MGVLTDKMKIIEIKKKGKHLNYIGKIPYYKISQNGLHMNGAYIDINN
jgi:hypothetical protein